MTETEAADLNALATSVWGRYALEGPPDADPDIRERESEALSTAVRIHLLSYVDDLSSIL